MLGKKPEELKLISLPFGQRFLRHRCDGGKSVDTHGLHPLAGLPMGGNSALAIWTPVSCST